MSGHLYNLKDIKDHYISFYDTLHNFFPLNGNNFQRKPKLIATTCILR